MYLHDGIHIYYWCQANQLYFAFNFRTFTAEKWLSPTSPSSYTKCRGESSAGRCARAHPSSDSKKDKQGSICFMYQWELYSILLPQLPADWYLSSLGSNSKALHSCVLLNVFVCTHTGRGDALLSCILDNLSNSELCFHFCISQLLLGVEFRMWNTQSTLVALLFLWFTLEKLWFKGLWWHLKDSMENPSTALPQLGRNLAIVPIMEWWNKGASKTSVYKAMCNVCYF